MSKPSDSDWKRMANLIDDFIKRPDCEPFREPVPWKELGLHDYPTIIKTPMDLGTIKKKIMSKSRNSKYYTNLYQCAEDVRLVWSNCQTYNADGSDFFRLAETLKKKWEKEYNKLLSDIGGANNNNQQQQQAAAAKVASAASSNPDAATASSGGGDANKSGGTGNSTEVSTPKVNLQEKRNFAKSLYQISKEDLGKILVDLETKCPSAITRNATEDEIELNVDNITYPVMQELIQFVNTAKGTGKKKTKKAKAASAPAAAAAAAASSSSATAMDTTS